MRLRPLAVLAAAALTASCVGAGGTAKTPAAPTRGSDAAAVDMAQALMLGCYTKVVHSTSGKGKTVLQLAILPDGSVAGVQVVETTIDDAEATACVVERASKWKTPFGSAAPRTIRYTLVIE